MDKALIDTDVILDSFFDRKPFAEYSGHILHLCETGKIKGYLTPVAYSNLYYILRQSAPHEKVIEKLKQLLKITDVLVMNKNVISYALDSGFKDFEDSLQNYSAVLSQKITLIITRNIRDYKKSELGVFTPELYLKSLNTTP